MKRDTSDGKVGITSEPCLEVKRSPILNTESYYKGQTSRVSTARMICVAKCHSDLARYPTRRSD